MHLHDDPRDPNDAQRISELIEKYPNILEEITRMCDLFQQYESIRQPSLQGLLGCDKNEASMFMKYFIELELIKCFDSSDTYVVMKDNFIGLKPIITAMSIIHELINK